MNSAADVTLIGSLAAIWLAAGLLAEGLPVARTAAELRHRAALLSILTGAGATVFVAVPLLANVIPGTSAAPTAALLAAIPALIVVTTTFRRLTQIRRGAGTLAAAPRTPVPPGLRAAAAHPLVAAPLQITGLAAVVGLPIAAGVVRLPGSDAAGIAITVVALVVAAIGIRHALRHSRLSLRATAPGKRLPEQLASRVL